MTVEKKMCNKISHDVGVSGKAVSFSSGSPVSDDDPRGRYSLLPR